MQTAATACIQGPEEQESAHMNKGERKALHCRSPTDQLSSNAEATTFRKPAPDRYHSNNRQKPEASLMDPQTSRSEFGEQRHVHTVSVPPRRTRTSCKGPQQPSRGGPGRRRPELLGGVPPPTPRDGQSPAVRTQRGDQTEGPVPSKKSHS